MKKKYLLLTLILLLISCGEKRGFDVLIDNTVKSNFTLLLDISDENGSQLVMLNIPIISSDNNNFKYGNFNKLNYDFTEILVRAELFSSKNGELIDSKIAMWPGKAGMSSSAGSNRIAIQLAIDEIDNKVRNRYVSCV